MKRNIGLHLIIALVMLVTCIIISCHRDEGGYTQFRMTGTGKDLPSEWSTDKNVRWTYDLAGRGWSSPVVSGNRVFFTSAVNETNPPKEEAEQAPLPQGNPNPQGPPPGQGNAPRAPRVQGSQQGQPPRPSVRREDTTYMTETYRWEVTCLDLKTGSELWKQVAFKGTPRTNSNRGNGYASETPATDGKKVYAYFGMTGIFCYDIKGNLLWEKDPGAYKTLNGWGTGSSPVLYNDMVFLQVDNDESSFLAAFDASTGEEKWRASREEKTTYSTPLIWKNSLRTELVTTGKKARSYDPLNGKLLWECKIDSGFSIPSASADENMLYIGNAGGPGKPGSLFAIKAGAQGDISLAEGTGSNDWIAWSLPAAGTGNPSPLLYKGLIYVVASNGGEIICFEAATGKSIYKQKVEKVAGCWASPWASEDRIYFTDERGVTRAFKAGVQFELVSENRVPDRFWASPAIADDSYVFKGVKKIYCIGK